jgi:hypothetical protein
MATTDVPSDIDAAQAAKLLPKLLADRERIASALDEARAEYERQTADLRSELGEVNAGLERVAQAIHNVAAADGGRDVAAGPPPDINTAPGLRAAIIDYAKRQGPRFFTARDVARDIPGVETGTKLTRAFNALVDANALERNGRGVGTKYRYKV